LQWIPCEEVQDTFDLQVLLLEGEEQVPDVEGIKFFVLTSEPGQKQFYQSRVAGVFPLDLPTRCFHHLMLQYLKGTSLERHQKNKLLAILQKLNTFEDLKSLLEFVIESVNELCNSQRASLFLADHETQELYSQVAMGMEGKEIRFPIGVGIAGSVAASLETVLIQDAYQDSRFNPAFDKQTGFRTRNILCMPMCNLEGKLIGVIQILNKRGRPFLDDDVELLSSFNTLSALIIESVDLMERTQNLNEELKHALRNNRLLLENVRDGFLLLDSSSRIMTGYAKSCAILLKDYFQGKELEGQSFLKIPFQGVDNDSAEFLQGLEGWLELGWGRTSIEGWDEFTQNKKFRLGDRILNCSFRRVLGPKKSIVAVLATLQDFTQSFQLREQMQRQAYESKLLLEMVQLITGLGRWAFRSSMVSFQSVLEEVSRHLDGAVLGREKIRKIFGEYHTLKGIFQNVGLKTLAELCHEEEHFWTIKPALTHVLRNCLDHGFENLHEAEKVGELYFDYRVMDSGPLQFELFEIKDNGKGIDPEALYKKALECKVVSADENLSPQEVLRLICKPGLSTRSTLSDVSGRGMGMDVVLEIVEGKLGGKLQIESAPGEGSKFLFKIPRFD